jgi:translocation and assembly module TamA
MMARLFPLSPVLALALVLSLTGFGGAALDRLDFVVTGEDAKLTADLRAASGLLAAEKARRTNALDLLADARAEYGRLISALYAKGHYNPVIHVLVDGREAASIAPLDAPAAIGKIVVTVDPGQPFTFSQAEVTPLAARTALPPGFATGQVAESQVIKDAVLAGVNGWRALGYAKTSVAAQDLIADHTALTLSAAVVLDRGPLLRFGPLTVNGTNRMRPDRVRAIAGLPEGDRFDPDDATRAADRLRRSGVFSSVTLTEDEFITAPDILGFSVDLVEARPRRYAFGAEIASYDGALLSAGWLHRNLLGGGERFEVTGEVAGIAGQTGGADYQLGFTLDRPATPWPDTELNLGAEISQINDADTTAQLANISAGFTQYFTNTLTAQAALRFAASQGQDAAGEYDYQSLELPLSATWDRRDSKTEPTRMFYLDLGAKPFFGFGNTDNGARLTFDARGYAALGERDNLVMALRVQGGAVLGADLLATPRGDLFYSGGGGTVRGQPYQSLGVNVAKLGTDIRLGGNQFMALSLEARAKVTEKIGVVGFVDMGLVGVAGGDSDTQAGAGFGLRYATGVGPVRLDLAVPLNDDGGKVQIYVGLGQAF